MDSLNENFIIDFLLSQGNGIILYFFPDVCPILLLKEAILRGFQIKSNLVSDISNETDNTFQMPCRVDIRFRPFINFECYNGNKDGPWTERNGNNAISPILPLGDSPANMGFFFSGSFQELQHESELQETPTNPPYYLGF